MAQEPCDLVYRELLRRATKGSRRKLGFWGARPGQKRKLTVDRRTPGCPQPTDAMDGRWAVSCGVAARSGVHSCFSVLHPPRVGVGRDQGSTNCPQRLAACPGVRVGGWVPILAVSWGPGTLSATCRDRGAPWGGAHLRRGLSRAAACLLTAPTGPSGGPRMGTSRGEPLGG